MTSKRSKSFPELIASYDKLHAGASENDTFRGYNRAFYIYHPGSKQHIMFDLGLSSDRQDYTPWVNKFMFDTVVFTGPRKPIPTQLQERGIKADQISKIFFSHAHWDHCRPFSPLFSSATGLFGPDTRPFCPPGHLTDPSGPSSQYDGRMFGPDATEPIEEFTGPWVRFSPFDTAMDYFGDGSFWIGDAPGHLPGNIAAVARLADREWVLLGGDCCHTRAIFDGLVDFAQFSLPDGSKACIHLDIPAARDTLRKLKEMEEVYGVHICFAHDAKWMQKGVDETLMGLLSEDMRAFTGDRLLRDEPV